MGGISDQEANAIVAIERVCSAFSLLGCVFVITTFSISPAFRQRAINRLVFFATFGNMLTNIATLMTRSYTLSVNSFGCQFQAFLIQVFMQGDAYWALAMAINVYLTFYHKYDARALRKMELPYLACCYGIPFIPGFVFVFLNTEHAGRPYGNAVLWCWLKPEWEIFRIATFYGPVWVAIIITISIYIRAGRDIYIKRRKMLNFSSSGTGTGTNLDPFSPANEFFSYKTTEVVQTTEIIKPPPTNMKRALSAATKDANVSYSVTISADTTATLPQRGDSIDIVPDTRDRDSQLNTNTTTTIVIPISTAARPGTRATTQTTAQIYPSVNQQARRRNYEAHNATWSYAKCALLFFSVLLITWIPSSGNRVYSLINNGDVSKPLFFASAFVLPLQGFWNAIIYIVTSWAACKSLWTNTTILPGRGEIKQGVLGRLHREQGGGGGGGGKWTKAEDSTSMEDLTGEGRGEETGRGMV
ncbi:hypothetical protein B0T19DRAFT_287684 [Cercophora scortea]|uniref:G-protein coupled receptors family 2 profile 2 domain-containing protein n=1 Tax=Cercophora scortea TaxID=314031 RepID=A0AAE0I431_9PEZI|nr:hypothetical protein B0T19DRAFT_287684 [Cercophora scortea]